MPGKNIASLTLVSSDESSASFSVAFTGGKKANQYSLWVALNGYDADDVHRSAAFAGIIWDGTAGAVTVPKNADPTHPVTRYEAFVALFPDVWSPVSNTLTI